ncbi:MAG: NAD(P)H-dependent oxidoreductase [Ferruginibacter sp.]|nr:NAD(P)H-dependent oxidoreductase [Ferruginibacter sp.]
MITIISGTNRQGSNTKKIAKQYSRFLNERNVENKILALDEYNVYERNANFEAMENEFLKTADKFIFVVAEYNGSFPGILKLMIDNTDVKKVWPNKKALLVGVSTGRAGNLRGLEHLTSSLMHLKIHVHPNRLPVSVVHTLLNEAEEIIDDATLKTMNEQVDEFLVF